LRGNNGKLLAEMSRKMIVMVVRNMWMGESGIEVADNLGRNEVHPSLVLS
jgi:hypothetical protein